MFPLVHDTNSKEIILIIVDHLITFEDNIQKYFLSLNIEKYDWVRNPFISTSDDFDLKLSEQEELASISSDRSLKIKQSETSLDTFWISIKTEYPEISKKALVALMAFFNSYLYELGFSALTTMKRKKTERHGCIVNDMRDLHGPIF